MKTLADGTVVQSGFARAYVNRTAEKQVPFTVIGTVFGVYYPDDQRNRSKKFMEYDIALWSPRINLFRVPMMAPRNGTQDGDVTVLRAAAKLNDNDYSTDTDGDVVVVIFIEGDSRRPMILGCYSHPKGTIITKTADGEVKRIKHKGATIEIKKDGEVDIISSGGAFATLLADGTVNVKPAAGKLLNLHGATQFLALASKIVAKLNQLIGVYNSHTHDVTGVTGSSAPAAHTHAIGPTTTTALVTTMLQTNAAANQFDSADIKVS